MKFITSVLIVLSLFAFILSCSSDDNLMNQDQITENPSDSDGNPIDTSENTKPTGTSANDLLSETQYEKLVLEIVYVEGFKPTENTIAAFRNFLINRLKKSQGVDIEMREIPSPEKSRYTIQDIISQEINNRTKYTNGNEIAVFAMFLDGDYADNTQNSSVLGIAYRNTSFVIFEKTVKDFTQGVLAPSLEVLETTVVNHEFGHLLGLVNAGSPLQSDHQDTEHGKHCTEQDCLMYYTAETGEGIINMLSGGSVPSLDAQCIADLQANGGK